MSQRVVYDGDTIVPMREFVATPPVDSKPKTPEEIEDAAPLPMPCPILIMECSTTTMIGGTIVDGAMTDGQAERKMKKLKAKKPGAEFFTVHPVRKAAPNPQPIIVENVVFGGAK